MQEPYRTGKICRGIHRLREPPKKLRITIADNGQYPKGGTHYILQCVAVKRESGVTKRAPRSHSMVRPD